MTENSSDYRFDGVVNLFTGQGTHRDKSKYNTIAPTTILDPTELEWFYRNSFLAQNIVNIIVSESVREWVNYDIPHVYKRKDPVLDISDYQDNLQDIYGYPITFKDAITEALLDERLYGGAVIIMEIDDGRPRYEPVDEKNIKSIEWIQVLDRYQIQPEVFVGEEWAIAEKQRKTEKLKRKFGRIDFGDLRFPTHYQINSADYVGVEPIHHSRVLRFSGAVRLPRRLAQINSGWGDPVLQVLFEPVLKFEVASGVLAALIPDAQTIEHQISGLWDMVNSDRAFGNFQTIQNRIIQSDLQRSAFRREVIDKEREAVNVITRDLSSLIQATELLLGHVVAASRLPHTFLLGESPTGKLGVSGESEQLDVSRTIAEFQSDRIMAHINRFNRLCMLSKNGPTQGKLIKGFQAKFNNPRPLTRKQEAEIQQILANTDAVNIQSGLYTPEEAAKARYSGVKFGEIVIDWEAREREAQAKKQQEEEANASQLKLEDFVGDKNE